MGSLTWLAVCVSLLLCEVCQSTDVPIVELNDGRKMPGFGFGTWLGYEEDGQTLKVPKDDSMQKAVETAIDTGYRHIDTASIYKTEAQVGRAVNKKIAEGVVKREDMFITTKLWNNRHAPSDVMPALQESLAEHCLEYVDLYLVHWPMAQFDNGTDQDIDYLDTWKAMVDARDRGFTKSIGLSNFNQEMIERLICETGVKPAVLEIEVNLNMQQPSLLPYCKQQGIAVIGFSPFGSLFPGRARPNAPPPRVDDPSLVSIAEKHNKTVPQVVLRYLLDLGVTPIPKTETKSRVAENFNIFDFQLTNEDREVMSGFHNGYRVIDVEYWSNSKYFPF